MMQSPKKDMAGVISFYPSERPDLVRQLSRLPSYSKDELRSNYHRVDWTQYEVISVYENNGIVQGFSVAWHTELAMPHLIDMIQHQLAMCKELGFTEAFISREKSPRYFRKLITSIQEKTNIQWHLYDDKQCVCMPKSSSCWQYKASTKL